MGMVQVPPYHIPFFRWKMGMCLFIYYFKRKKGLHIGIFKSICRGEIQCQNIMPKLDIYD
jgi:hypothetical protein